MSPDADNFAVQLPCSSIPDLAPTRSRRYSSTCPPYHDGITFSSIGRIKVQRPVRTPSANTNSFPEPVSSFSDARVCAVSCAVFLKTSGEAPRWKTPTARTLTELS